MKPTRFEQLEKVLAMNSYFDDHNLKPGTLRDIWELHGKPSIKEVELAVLNINQRPDIYDPLGALRSFGFKNGKCNIHLPVDTSHQHKEEDYTPPLWESAKAWFDKLAPTDQAEIRGLIRQSLDIFLKEYESLLTSYSPGRAYLIEHFREQVLEKPLYEFRRGYATMTPSKMTETLRQEYALKKVQRDRRRV